MHFRVTFALLALSGIAAAEPVDGNDLDGRDFAPPGCYCCTGYVVKDNVGTRCGGLGGSCASGDILCCDEGAVILPRLNSQNSSSIVCKGKA